MRPLIAILVSLAVLAATASALAHNTTFTSATEEVATSAEPVIIQYSAPFKLIKVSLTGPAGSAPQTRQITNGDIRYQGSTARIALPSSAAGTYTLRWSVPQADGHLVTRSHDITVAQSNASNTQTPSGRSGGLLEGLSGSPSLPAFTRPRVAQDPKKTAQLTIQNELARIARVAIAYLAIKSR